MKHLPIGLMVCMGLAGCSRMADPGPVRTELPVDITHAEQVPAAQQSLVAPDAVTTLTLRRALEIADQSHPELIAARARIQAMEGNARQAGLYPNPELIGRAEAIPLDNGSAGDAEYLAGISQPIPLGDRLSLARRTDRFRAERLRWQAEQKRRSIHRRIRRAFYEFSYLQELESVQQRAVEIARNGFTFAQARVQAGDAIAAEADRASIELQRMNINLRETVSMKEQAMADLLLVMGDTGLSVNAVETDFEIPTDTPSADSLLTNIHTSPALRAARSAIAVEESQLELAKELRKPDVNVELGYRRIGSEENALDVGFSIPIPLFNRQQGRIEAAEAGLNATRAEATARERTLESEIRETARRLTRLRNQVRTMREEILAKSDGMLSNAELRYRAGDLSLEAILPVRREWVQLQRDYLDAMRDLMLAWADLSQYVDHTSE